MAFLSGKRLTAVGAALIALAGAAAVRVALSGALRGAGTDAASPPAVAGAATRPGEAAVPRASGLPGTAGAAGRAATLSAADHVALALAAERRGDVAGALSHYRAAVESDPGCVDSRSPSFLGEVFGLKLKGWIAGIENGRIAGGPAAVEDASFIFRRMYGGCG